MPKAACHAGCWHAAGRRLGHHPGTVGARRARLSHPVRGDDAWCGAPSRTGWSAARSSSAHWPHSPPWAPPPRPGHGTERLHPLHRLRRRKPAVPGRPAPRLLHRPGPLRPDRAGSRPRRPAVRHRAAPPGRQSAARADPLPARQPHPGGRPVPPRRVSPGAALGPISNCR